MLFKLAAFATVLALAAADDPAGSWLSYAAWTAPGDGEITMLNTTWVVPSNPEQKMGSNAPGWWFGLQTSKGNGALIQPILAYGYKGNVYSIFNACFDWTDGSWNTSPETYTVEPGDTIISSVYKSGERTFTMEIASKNTGKKITTPYTLKRGQSLPESTAYFVLEHQPRTCKAYPTNGDCKFENIYVEVAGKPATPEWKAVQERPACNSKATVIDAKTIDFTWTNSGNTLGLEETDAPLKWLDSNATAPLIACKSASGGPGGQCGAQDDSCCDGPPGVGQSCYASATQDCCTDGPGKGHVCAKGKCSTRAGFICD